MRTRTVTLHSTGGTLLMTLIVRDNDASEDLPLRNYDAVQPPGATVQGAWGDGTLRAGVLERDFALCGTSSYTSVWHAKHELDEYLQNTASIRVEGWELELAAVPGVVRFQHQVSGFMARIRFIPKAAAWRLMTDHAVTATGIL